MKKLIVLGLIGGALMFAASCTPGEIGAGAIGVGIGIGLGGGYGHPHHPPHHPPHYPHPYPCGPYNCYQATLQANNLPLDTSVSDFADQYGISQKAAAKIKTAFDGVQTQGIASFQSIGLKSSDLRAFMNHTLPSPTAIQSFADQMDMSQAQGRDLLLAMMHEFEAQSADVNSPYWQHCIDQGKWKTPQNMYCKNAAWPGCSPETGANFCY
jgi:hypothetical protein